MIEHKQLKDIEEFAAKCAADETPVIKHVYNNDNIYYTCSRGLYHNKHGPAIIFKDGTTKWMMFGLLHRVDGPAVEYADGAKAWYQCGVFHRLDGPAYEGLDGHREWAVCDKLHRLDGPAVQEPGAADRWFVDDVECQDAAEWAAMALEFQGIAPTKANVQQLVQQVMQQDLFN